MKVKFISIIFLSVLLSGLNAQIVLNGGSKIIISGGTSGSNIFVVLNSPPATPIVTSGAVDGIIMEAEYNRLQYNLGTGTTAITVPYMSSSLESFPLTVSSITAGTGAGNIRFSTTKSATRATGWDNQNDGYKPSDVVNMSAVGAANNSNKTIDRFWIIDANGYTANPGVTLSFTYIDAEWAANGGNSISEGNLRAQRFNSTIGSWDAYAPAGTINTATNIVSAVTVPSADFFRSWTLNDNTSPLPIELVKFEANCAKKEEKGVVLNWTTASETNNSYFTIERSTDGINWISIAVITGAGNSTQTVDYSYSDNHSEQGIVYYRLKQTDFDGKYAYSDIISTRCDDEAPEVNIYPNPFASNLFIVPVKFKTDYEIIITDVIGQLIYDQKFLTNQQNDAVELDLSKQANGVYFITIITSGKTITERLVKQ